MELPNRVATGERRCASGRPARDVLRCHLGDQPDGVPREPGPRTSTCAPCQIPLDAGFSGVTATRAYNLLDSYIYGFVLQETTLPFGSTNEMEAQATSMMGEMAPGEYENLRAIAAALVAAGFKYADEFEFGLDLILDGIERELAVHS